MPTTAALGATPYYVLMDGNRPIGPKILPTGVGSECDIICGFSGKASYEKYLLNSPVALKPYPLVKGYLRKQANAPSDGLKLVVVNAAGPQEPSLHAATMEAVLEAHESKMASVTAAYRLVFDQQSETYRVEVISE